MIKKDLKKLLKEANPKKFPKKCTFNYYNIPYLMVEPKTIIYLERFNVIIEFWLNKNWLLKRNEKKNPPSVFFKY